MLHHLFTGSRRKLTSKSLAVARRKLSKQRHGRHLFLEPLEDRRLLATLSIDDVSVPEGNTGTTPAVFSVTLDTPSLSTVTVDYNTVLGGTAAASDFVATSGVVTFAPGETSQPITVDILGDTLMERDETYQVILSAPTNAVLYDNLGQVTIVDDDVEAIYATPTGPLDVTWDGDGIKNFKRPESATDAAAGTAIDPDGRVLVFGNYPGARSSEAFAVRYFHNGVPDLSFGASGIATLPRPNNSGILQVFGGAVYASGANRGKVLVHAAYGSSNDDILVARFNVDGSLDATFGSGQGYAQLDSGSIRDWSQDIAIYESGPHAGKFIVVGASSVASIDATGLIARYDADGTLDPTFGLGQGWLSYRQTYTDDDAAIKPTDSTDFDRVLFDSDGMIVISGTTGRPGAYDSGTDTRTSTAALWRFDNAGNLDNANFGTGGVAFSPLDSYSGTFNDVAIQSDGKIVQQVEQVNLNPGLAMGRFTPDGQLDLSFGVAGNGTVTSNGFGAAKTLSLDAADRILVGGETGPVGLGHFFVTRYSADGVLDHGFDPVQLDGSISPALDSIGYRYNLHGAVLNSDANLLLAGHRSPPFPTPAPRK